MSVDGQTAQMYQGTHRTIRLAIPIGSSGYDHTDVSASSFALIRAGSAVLTKTQAGADISVTSDGTYINFDCALVPADTSALVGVYRFEWVATIDSKTDIRATGNMTVEEAALS